MPRTSRRIAAVLAIVAAVALLVPSGATPFPMDTPSDRVGNDVEVVPAPGDGGTYARMVGGDLVVDFSPNPFHADAGFNPGSVTRIGEVFLIRYSGSQHADFWVSHEAEGLTFSVAGEPIESSSRAVELRPNETVAVDIEIRTTDTASLEGADRFLIHTREYTDEDPDENTAEDDYRVHEDPDSSDTTTTTTATTTSNENDSVTDSDGGETAGDSGGTTATVGGDDDRVRSTATPVEHTNEIAIETETTAFERLVSGGIGWPLAIVVALMLVITALLESRRRRS